ncbi:hypothetical protein [Nocardioides sp. Kera G14]|uniref:hypothetical protein n=1 Tax=Nocardioides sp. Kera G14 TaxID=2884264 RepID=UPI001D11BF27|nr:hypothetical protein [Nocardioides sp. Kera G14]UDY22841.1 hypothetical protein LH076_12280 [Nocardioides sp. Kera G14]
MKRFLISVVVVAFLAAAATVAWREFGDQAAKLLPDECLAQVDNGTNDLKARVNPEQARNAALIASISIKRGLPARAATIALATAYQESKLYNIDYGDRDSVGLFQQRPSQGWGSRTQLLNTTYATNAFYDALIKIDGYETMEITVAAQKVQRSAFPDAYADHEPGARALASSLTGQSAAAFSCRFGSIKVGTVGTVRDRIVSAFGAAAGTPVITGHAITVSPGKSTTGWAIAQWAVAYANRLGVASVAYDGHRWSGDEGWKSSSTAGDQLVVTVKQSEK